MNDFFVFVDFVNFCVVFKMAGKHLHKKHRLFTIICAKKFRGNNVSIFNLYKVHKKILN